MSAQSDLRANYLLLANDIIFYTSGDSVALKSDCADAENDLELNSLYMAYYPTG